jgi:hypothetical protein
MVGVYLQRGSTVQPQAIQFSMLQYASKFFPTTAFASDQRSTLKQLDIENSDLKN